MQQAKSERISQDLSSANIKLADALAKIGTIAELPPVLREAMSDLLNANQFLASALKIASEMTSPALDRRISLTGGVFSKIVNNFFPKLQDSNPISWEEFKKFVVSFPPNEASARVTLSKVKTSGLFNIDSETVSLSELGVDNFRKLQTRKV